MREKLVTLTEAAALVRDGDVVGLQAGPTQCAPTALVRELVRRRARDLHVVLLSGSIALDWLVAAGAVRRVTFAVVTLEHHGLCQRFRRAVEAGDVETEELSETALLARLGAGARHLPFLTTRGMIGTDLLEVGNPALRVLEDPFGGPPVVACAALRPDVALLHAARADRFGNVALDPGPRHPMTTLLPRAAERVVVTVEEVVDTEELRRAPERTVLPGFAVDAVVPVPHGAHPTSLFPRYDHDPAAFAAWVAAARDDAATQAFLDRWVRGPADQAAYLAAVGEDRLAGLATPTAREPR